MQNNRIKYQVIRCAEREMSIVGIFSTPEDAKKAMKKDMTEILECSETDLDAAIKGETEDPDVVVDIDCEELGVEDNSAWANDVGLAHANVDWKIFRLTCDGECCEYAPGDENIINATYRTYWVSGANFDAPCKVNLKTHEVFEAGSAGSASGDDNLYEEDVVIHDNDTDKDKEYEVVNLDEFDELDAHEGLGELLKVKSEGRYWCGSISLETAIEKAKNEVLFC